MQYLGGKFRQAKRLVARIKEIAGHDERSVIEPFCGACNMTAEFARNGFSVRAYDAHPALIPMWQAAQKGWLPPERVTKEDYEAAKALPDSDPLKAAIGFGMSFGGQYFQAFTGEISKQGQDYASCAHRAIAKKAARLDAVLFAHANFFDLQPTPTILYCDPPYAGTAGYRGTLNFDSVAFWARCQEWAEVGAHVFVSEYSAPADIQSVLCLQRVQGLRPSRGEGSQKADQVRQEHLFYIPPKAR